MRQHDRREYSVVDATSFAVMRRRRPRDAFDFDGDFAAAGFREFRAFSPDCKFSGCTHRHEPGCAVRAAVEAGEVAESRSHSYRDMLEGIDEESPYRTD